jgi:hypothetical protein
VAIDSTPSEVDRGSLPPRWLWPLRLSPGLREQTLRQARRLAALLGPWPCWLLAGLLIGTLPCLIEYISGWPCARLITAIFLTPILVAAVVEDSLLRAIAAMTATFAAHSLLVIGLAIHQPAAMASLAPAEPYWQESLAWITTGVSREYELSWWLPAHGQWFAAVTLFTYLSLGLVTFWQGLFEVDLMNYYVGRLVAHSANPWLGLALGWHPWSVCRALGYLFITFEVTSFSCERLTGTRLSTAGRRRARWIAGLAFLGLDCILKYALLETIRSALADNLL